MTRALLLRTDCTHEIITLDNGSTLRQLQDCVGGMIDCVRAPDVVGYVNDEGLLLEMEPNLIASVAFNQAVVGPVVIVGALNDSGWYDGENHDVPQEFIEVVEALVDTVRLFVGDDENITEVLGFLLTVTGKDA